MTIVMDILAIPHLEYVTREENDDNSDSDSGPGAADFGENLQLASFGGF